MRWNDIRWFSAYLALMIVMIPFALLPPKVSAAFGRKTRHASISPSQQMAEKRGTDSHRHAAVYAGATLLEL